jgi:hypothetical protein
MEHDELVRHTFVQKCGLSSYNVCSREGREAGLSIV